MGRQDYASLHAEWKAKGYRPVDCRPIEQEGEVLDLLSLRKSTQKYDSVIVMPSELAFRGEEWAPAVPSVVVYAKFKGSTSRRRQSPSALDPVICKDVRSGGTTLRARRIDI